MGMGILSSRRNQITGATQYFDQALSCAPNDGIIIREAGRFHYTKGNRGKGFDLLRRAVQMNFNDVLAMYHYARALNDMGRNEEAIDYARRVSLKVPDDAEVHDLLARLYGARKQLFLAHLHLAYSGLYDNNERKVKQNLDKAKNLSKNNTQKIQIERFESQFKERKQYWK